jgi:hypothetical protein
MLNFCTFGIRLSRYCIQAAIWECSANSYFARAIVATRVTLHACKPLTVPFCRPFNRRDTFDRDNAAASVHRKGFERQR